MSSAKQAQVTMQIQNSFLFFSLIGKEQKNLLNYTGSIARSPNGQKKGKTYKPPLAYKKWLSISFFLIMTLLSSIFPKLCPLPFEDKISASSSNLSWLQLPLLLPFSFLFEHLYLHAPTTYKATSQKETSRLISSSLLRQNTTPSQSLHLLQNGKELSFRTLNW